MPGRDGTGPTGQGPIGGGMGRGGRMGAGGRGRMGGNIAAGPTGFCVCPQCGERVPHQPAVPCTLVTCPKCGTKMVRG